MKKYKKIILTLSIILFIGIFPISDYSFYSILRWVVCGGSLYLESIYYDENKKINYIIAIIAIVFNPIIPIYMDKESWIVVDLMSAGYYFYYYSEKTK